jgi:hypothetical protein
MFKIEMSNDTAPPGGAMTLHPAALWRRAAIAWAEQSLTGLKARLFDPSSGPVDLDAIREHERYLAHLRQLGGEALLGEYEYWLRHYPAHTRGLLRTMAACCRAERQALDEYWSKKGRVAPMRNLMRPANADTYGHHTRKRSR